jgi:hypothetical protein
MSDAKVHVRYGLLCDDVRQEDNGKFILIGTYNFDIQVTEVPVTLILRLVVGIDIKEVLDPAELELVASLSDETLVAGKGKIGLRSQVSTILPLPPIRLRIEHDGILQFRLRFSPSDPWATAWSGPIKLVSAD